MGLIIPCCPTLQPPDFFFDITCIQGFGPGGGEYRVALLSVENPTATTTRVTYQVCRCSGDVSHVTFQVCDDGPTPIEMGDFPDVVPPNTQPDNLPFTTAKFDWPGDEQACALLVLNYDEFFTFQEGTTFMDIGVFISQTGNLFQGTILGPCFGND